MKSRIVRWIALLCFAGAFAPVGTAAAQEGNAAAPTSKDDSAQGFEAASDEDIQRENLPGWPFLYFAYSFFWVFLLAYVGYLWKVQKGLEGQIQNIDKRLDLVDASLEQLEKG